MPSINFLGRKIYATRGEISSLERIVERAKQSVTEERDRMISCADKLWRMEHDCEPPYYDPNQSLDPVPPSQTA